MKLLRRAEGKLTKSSKKELEEYKFFSVRKENLNTAVQHNFKARNREEPIQKFDKDWLKYFNSSLDVKTTVNILESEPKLYF